jgi:hypothetical protein
VYSPSWHLCEKVKLHHSKTKAQVFIYYSLNKTCQHLNNVFAQDECSINQTEVNELLLGMSYETHCDFGEHFGNILET